MGYLYDGFHKIEQVITMIKGRKVKREKLILHSSVAGLVVNQNGEMALVKQFRPAIEGNSFEIPAGIMDKGKSKKQTFIEELQEECNINPEDIVTFIEKPKHEYHMFIGSSDATLSLFYVTVKNQNEKIVYVDDNDVDYVKWFSLQEIEQMKSSGEIKDAKTIIAYYLFKDMLTKKPNVY